MKNVLNLLSTIMAIVFTALTLFADDRGGGGPGGGFKKAQAFLIEANKLITLVSNDIGDISESCGRLQEAAPC